MKYEMSYHHLRADLSLAIRSGPSGEICITQAIYSSYTVGTLTLKSIFKNSFLVFVHLLHSRKKKYFLLGIFSGLVRTVNSSYRIIIKLVGLTRVTNLAILSLALANF